MGRSREARREPETFQRGHEAQNLAEVHATCAASKGTEEEMRHAPNKARRYTDKGFEPYPDVELGDLEKTLSDAGIPVPETPEEKAFAAKLWEKWKASHE